LIKETKQLFNAITQIYPILWDIIAIFAIFSLLSKQNRRHSAKYKFKVKDVVSSIFLMIVRLNKA